MPEIKRESRIIPDPENEGEVLICFDCNHTTRDILRYLGADDNQGDWLKFLIDMIAKNEDVG